MSRVLYVCGTINIIFGFALIFWAILSVPDHPPAIWPEHLSASWVPPIPRWLRLMTIRLILGFATVALGVGMFLMVDARWP